MVKYLCLTLCFVLSNFCPDVFAKDNKITVLTEEWPPYNFTEAGELKGFSVELVQHIIRDLNVDAEIKVYPSMRASLILSREPRTMFISMFRTPEREQKYQWIGPLVDSSIYFYKNKSNPSEFNTLDDVRQAELIATRHAGLVFSMLKSAGFTNLDNNAVDGYSVYRKVLMGRSDLGISDSAMGVKYILKKLNYPADALTQIPVKIVNSTLYIAVSKDVPLAEVGQWQDSLDRLKAMGVYDQIYQKYN